jgi:hypothetical protein
MSFEVTCLAIAALCNVIVLAKVIKDRKNERNRFALKELKSIRAKRLTTKNR